MPSPSHAIHAYQAATHPVVVGGVAHAEERVNQVPDSDIVLFQYNACPFANKVKAFLDYNRIPYRSVEVNPVTKKEIAWSSYKKVPQALIGGEAVHGSGDIIMALLPRERAAPTASRWSFGKAAPPARPIEGEELKYFTWVDTVLVHVITANIYSSLRSSFEVFDYIAQENFGPVDRAVIRAVGPVAMYFVAKYKIKKQHNIQDEREALGRCVAEWAAAVGERPFHGGRQPDLADIAVFGVLRSIETLGTMQHVRENTRAGEWFDRMKAAVGPSMRLAIVDAPAPDFKATVVRPRSGTQQ